MVFIISVVWLISAGADLSSAEEEYSHFSLGYGRLNPAAVDPKIPAPGVVTALYGLNIAKDFMPYVGTGLAYSIQPEVRLGDTAPRIKAGVAGQAGFRFMLDENAALRVDYKYLHLDPDVSHGGTKTPPQSLGVGIDIKF